MEVDFSALLSVSGNLVFAGAVVKLFWKMERRIVVLETKFEGMNR